MSTVSTNHLFYIAEKRHDGHGCKKAAYVSSLNDVISFRKSNFGVGTPLRRNCIQLLVNICSVQIPNVIHATLSVAACMSHLWEGAVWLIGAHAVFWPSLFFFFCPSAPYRGHYCYNCKQIIHLWCIKRQLWFGWVAYKSSPDAQYCAFLAIL